MPLPAVAFAALHQQTEQRRKSSCSNAAQPSKVNVIGVWDTVGSVGVAARNIPGITRGTFDYLQTGLRIYILNGYHALAIDKHRKDFAPTLWDVHHAKDQNAVIAQHLFIQHHSA